MRIATFFLTSILCPSLLVAAQFDPGHTSERFVSVSSSWVSRLGSVMVLDIGADGLVEGYLVNNAPGKGCRGIPYPLNGRMAGNVITFQVRWRNGVADCMAETQWRGHLQPSRCGGTEIVAEWQRSSNVATMAPHDETPQKGVDLFTFQAIAELPAGITP